MLNASLSILVLSGFVVHSVVLHIFVANLLLNNFSSHHVVVVAVGSSVSLSCWLLFCHSWGVVDDDATGHPHPVHQSLVVVFVDLLGHHSSKSFVAVDVAAQFQRHFVVGCAVAAATRLALSLWL